MPLAGDDEELAAPLIPVVVVPVIPVVVLFMPPVVVPGIPLGLEPTPMPADTPAAFPAPAARAGTVKIMAPQTAVARRKTFPGFMRFSWIACEVTTHGPG